MKDIILASTSPRRQEIMRQLGIPFTVESSDYEEDMTLDLSPHELAKHLATGKAQAVAAKHTNALVIGGDSFVMLGDEKLGKPKSPEEAKQMLRKLSGQAQRIITGLAVIDTETNQVIAEAIEGKVFFRELRDQEIDAYIATGEPLDKAGAYAVQGLGAVFIERIEGDYFAMVGLPIGRLVTILRSFGVTILE